jgi:hypothetical protein
MADRSDVERLEDLLTHEERLASAYEAALRRDAIEPALGEALLADERRHARGVEDSLPKGGARNPRASVPAPELAAALGDRESFARFAIELEERAIAAYREAVPAIRDPSLRQPLGSILACSAAHVVALRESLGSLYLTG